MKEIPQNHMKFSRKSKILIFLIFSFLFCQSLLSQFYWQKTYKSYIGGDDECYDGCAADGSNFYIVGYTGIQDYYMYVLKLNQLGDTLWTRTYIGGIANAVTSSGDGGCVFTGQRNSCFSMKLDLNGNLVWDKSYPTGAETRDISRTADSGYIMCGGFFSGYICKLDTLGNLQWEKYYNDTPQDFDKVEPDINGGYIVCGRKFSDGVWKAYLMKIDGMGNVEWEAFYDSPYFLSSFTKKYNGYILLIGIKINNIPRTTLVKTDLLGNVIKMDTILSNSLGDGSPKIISIDNNRFVISYYSRFTSPQRYIGKVLMIDSNLNITKNISLTVDTNSVYLNNLIKAPGSNIDDIICYGSAEPEGPFELDLYTVRLDSSLIQPPPISVNIISNQVPQKTELNQNYPNPFNPITNIKFEIQKDLNVSIKIFDILGREVFSINEYKQAGSYEVQFDGTNFASGIYFYKLEADGFSDTKKMVLLK